MGVGDAAPAARGRFRIALANIPFPPTPEESVALAERAIAQASGERADLIAEATGLLASRCRPA